nr:unnamed protein product [Spirometra erinaceieuropaei]
MRVGQDWSACGIVYGIQNGQRQGRIDTPDEIIRVKDDRREEPRRDWPHSRHSISGLSGKVAFLTSSGITETNGDEKSISST